MIVQKDAPLVSIIIPNYNHACFLERRIQSVLDQTYQDFEIILLDDASPDNSVEILSRFAQNPRVYKTIFNEVNSGSTFKQWNKGISQARGEYIWLAESDDYADKNLLENLVQPLNSNPNVGVSYCQSWAVNECDRICSSMQEWTDDLDKERWRKNFINSGLDECSRYIVQKCTVPNASAVVFRRSVYEKVGGADESFRLSGDWMMWTKMLLASDVAFTAEPLNFFRMHSNTVRGSCGKSELALKEAFLIVHHILQNIRVPKQIQEDTFNGLMNRWLAGIADYRWGFSTNVNVYRNFGRLDQQIHHRITNRLIKSLSKSFHSRVS